MWMLAFVLGVVCTISGLALWYRRSVARDPRWSTLDWVLFGLSIPLAGVVLISVVLFKGKPDALEASRSRDMVDSITEIEPPSERVVRVVEDIADKEGTHLREVATDDEVASKGAALFDPGTKT
jgi:hypothetical protein